MGSIHIHNISKAYKRYPQKWGRMAEWLGMGVHHDLRWVLRDICFDVKPGEAVGIIGINGAGKSTLLKIIADTTRPTAGSVEVSGRISALLELGMGFHPEFTGRQNAYMAAQLQGIKSSEMDYLIHEIENFAEIGDYFNQPMRTYSTGMQMRVAFSVATCVRPEILIIDEALSVGDTYFQHKSFDRIRQFHDNGTSLLFVSHSAGAVKTLCNRAILLDAGEVIKDDAPDAVLDYYNAVIAKQQADFEIRQTEQTLGQKITRSGSKEAVIEFVELYVDEKPVRALLSGQPVTVHVAGTASAAIEEFTVGILIRDCMGNDVFGTNTFHHGISLNRILQGESFGVNFHFPALNLGCGSFSLSVALHSRDAHVTSNYDWWDRAIVFEVIRGERPFSIGVCDLPVAIAWTKQ